MTVNTPAPTQLEVTPAAVNLVLSSTPTEKSAKTHVEDYWKKLTEP